MTGFSFESVCELGLGKREVLLGKHSFDLRFLTAPDAVQVYVYYFGPFGEGLVGCGRTGGAYAGDIYGDVETTEGLGCGEDGGEDGLGVVSVRFWVY
jgi:hypothetical protein